METEEDEERHVRQKMVRELHRDTASRDRAAETAARHGVR